MGKIIIEGLEILACHGVNSEEKTHPQRFVFTIDMDADIYKAASSDNIDDTVSYSAVKKYISAFATENRFDLIETLADRAAIGVLAAFDGLSGVTVTVKKPDAPMSGNFDFVACVAQRKWTKIYLSLGSNVGDRDAYLDLAVNCFKEDPRFKCVRESERICTLPYGGVAKGEFVNSALSADTCCSPDELLDFIGQVEENGGRVRRERWGDRTLDVDIVFFGDSVISTDRLTVPHPDMQNRNFVLDPLSRLAPNFVHPVLRKSVAELLRVLESGGMRN